MQTAVRVSFDSAVAADRRGYDIRIGPGLLEDLPDLLREACPAHRYAVIADSRVNELYGDLVLSVLGGAGHPVDLFQFPAGEANKSRAQWARLSDELLAAGLGRDAAVVALGGGVTGDLAGFVAATFLRGIPLVQIPTSLLAMIDSSVGGKTGVDTEAGKNLIGAFHQPLLVVADTETLSTLPAEEVRSGLAEAVKHGAIADHAYFAGIAERAESLLEVESSAMTELIRRSVEIKAAVVSADEREGGLRKTLNFGHTIGHAVEALSGFRLLHGEAVSIGMVVEAALGEALGRTQSGTADRLRETLERLGLPVAIPPDQATDRIVALTRVDKKARGGRVEYALIERIGAADAGTGSFGTPVDESEVIAAVDHCRQAS
ncbi:MAG: 3-dehydroquinate synthase [Gemmatimonadota bacterium]